MALWDDSFEPAWLDRLKRGDVEWFDELVKCSADKIFSMCWRFTLKKADAEDLCQEIFLLIYKNIRQFRGESSLSTWVYRIALNKAATGARQAAGRNKYILTYDVPYDRMEHTSYTDMFMQNDKSMDISKSIAELPGKYIKVIELYYFQDLTQKSIAKVLQIPQKTVETRLLRAREKLKAILINNGYGEEDING